MGKSLKRRCIVDFTCSFGADDLERRLCAPDMRLALRRCPDLSLIPRDGIAVTADPNRIFDAQVDIWRKSVKRKLLLAGVGNVAQESFMGSTRFCLVEGEALVTASAAKYCR